MLAGSAAVFAWPRAAGAQQLQRLRLIGVQTDDMTPVYYALSKGMYQKAGLEIELVPASSGTAATAAVVSGTYQLGKGSVIASLLAHIRNLPLVFIANGVVWDVKAPVTLAVVTVDSPIKTARDLAGKTASAAALNDIVTLSLNAWTDKNGGDSSAIKWVEIPTPRKPRRSLRTASTSAASTSRSSPLRSRAVRCASSHRAWMQSATIPVITSSSPPILRGRTGPRRIPKHAGTSSASPTRRRGIRMRTTPKPRRWLPTSRRSPWRRSVRSIARPAQHRPIRRCFNR